MAGQNKTGLTPQILRPVARPTDTFVQPERGGGVSQLADSLTRFAPSLSRYGNALAEEKGAKDQIEGQNAAREFVEAHKTYKQAIDAGLMEKHHSPFFRLGAYETFGRASAWRYRDDFREALKQSDVAESTSSDDFDKFEGEQRAKWMKENLGEKTDPYFANAFGSVADNLMNEDRSSFSSGAASRLVKQTGEAYHAEVHSIVKDSILSKAKPEDVLAQIHLAMDRQFAGHMGKGVVNELTASAIASAAIAAKNVTLLDYMDKIKVGSGFMSGTSYGSKAREEAEEKITSVNQSRHLAAAQEQEHTKKVALEDITGRLVTELAKATSPAAVDLKPYILEAVAAGDADSASKFDALQKAIADNEYTDNNAVKQRLFIGVHTGETSMARLDAALRAKAITFQTYGSLADDVRTRDKEGKEKGDSRLQAEVNGVESDIKFLFALERGGSTTELRSRAQNAADEGSYNYLKWLKTPEGSKANAEAKKQWVHAEAARQFGMKADAMDKKFLTGRHIPEANFQTGPLPVNPKKAPAAPAETIRQIQADYDKGKLSPGTRAVLKQLNVMPKDIKQFLDAQKKFLNP